MEINCWSALSRAAMAGDEFLDGLLSEVFLFQGILA
jgi:hypothetical protein